MVVLAATLVDVKIAGEEELKALLEIGCVVWVDHTRFVLWKERKKTSSTK